MKFLVYNTMLVAVLMSLFGLPLLGSKMISYQDEDEYSPIVLGAKHIENNAVRISGKEPVEIVAQFDYTVNLSGSSTEETIYDVVPAEYLNDDYEVVLITPLDVQNQGVYASLDRESGTSGDVLFVTSGNLKKPLAFPLTILVFE